MMKPTATFDISRFICGPGSSVGLVTDYGLDGPGFESYDMISYIISHLIIPYHIIYDMIWYDMIYSVIHKSLRDFRTRLRNNQDRRGRKEHINRERERHSKFLSYLTGARYVPPW